MIAKLREMGHSVKAANSSVPEEALIKLRAELPAKPQIEEAKEAENKEAEGKA